MSYWNLGSPQSRVLSHLPWDYRQCRLSELRTPTAFGVDKYENKHEYRYDELHRLIEVIQTTRPIYGKSRYGTVDYGEQVESRTFLYDELDRLKTVTFPDGKTIDYAYDPEGQLISLTDPHGKVTEYTYFNDGRLHEVIVKRPPDPDRVFAYSYDAAGRLLKIVYPTTPDIIEARFYGPAGPATEPGWDENGQLIRLFYTRNGGHLHSFEYGYDNSGNRISLVDTPETGPATTWEYTYTWLNQLKTVKRGVGVAPVLEREYVFDEADNRSFLDDHVNNRSLFYVYNDADQITEIREGTLGSRDTVSNFLTVLETFTSDDDGNLVSRTRVDTGVIQRYFQDDFDRMVRWENSTTGESEQHRYDTGNIRKHKVGADGVKVDFKYSGLPVLGEERDPGGAAVPTSFIQGHMVIGFEDASGFFYFLHDGLSSARVMVNSAGTEAAHYVHDEFGGRVEVAESGGSSPQTWVGGLGVRDEIPANGLYYMRHRWYEPTLGRFLSRDPVGALGGFNLYGYTGNNPVNDTDSTGLWTDVKSVLVELSKLGPQGAQIAGEISEALPALSKEVARSGPRDPAKRKFRITKDKDLRPLKRGVPGCTRNELRTEQEGLVFAGSIWIDPKLNDLSAAIVLGHEWTHWKDPALKSLTMWADEPKANTMTEFNFEVRGYKAQFELTERALALPGGKKRVNAGLQDVYRMHQGSKQEFRDWVIDIYDITP